MRLLEQKTKSLGWFFLVQKVNISIQQSILALGSNTCTSVSKKISCMIMKSAEYIMLIIKYNFPFGLLIWNLLRAFLVLCNFAMALRRISEECTLSNHRVERPLSHIGATQLVHTLSTAIVLTVLLLLNCSLQGPQKLARKLFKMFYLSALQTHLPFDPLVLMAWASCSSTSFVPSI